MQTHWIAPPPRKSVTVHSYICIFIFQKFVWRVVAPLVRFKTRLTYMCEWRTDCFGRILSSWWLNEYWLFSRGWGGGWGLKIFTPSDASWYYTLLTGIIRKIAWSPTSETWGEGRGDRPVSDVVSYYFFRLFFLWSLSLSRGLEKRGSRVDSFFFFLPLVSRVDVQRYLVCIYNGFVLKILLFLDLYIYTQTLVLNGRFLQWTKQHSEHTDYSRKTREQRKHDKCELRLFVTLPPA